MPIKVSLIHRTARKYSFGVQKRIKLFSCEWKRKTSRKRNKSMTISHVLKSNTTWQQQQKSTNLKFFGLFFCYKLKLDKNLYSLTFYIEITSFQDFENVRKSHWNFDRCVGLNMLWKYRRYMGQTSFNFLFYLIFEIDGLKCNTRLKSLKLNCD